MSVYRKVLSQKRLIRSAGVASIPTGPIGLGAFHGASVKLIMERDGQGESIGPNADELVLRRHIGEMCDVIKTAKMSVLLRFVNGETAWAIPEEISRNAKAAVNPSNYIDDAAEWARRLIDRNDGDFNQAAHQAHLAWQDSEYSGDRVLMGRVCDEIARMKRTLKVTVGTTAANEFPSGRKGCGLPLGSECNCGGNNNNCFRCSGTGIVQ